MTDGNIALARKKLSEAIRDLIDRQPKTLIRDNGRMELHHLPSRYQHLEDSLGGQNVTEKSGGQARLPLWADAADLIRDIDTTIVTWTAPYPGDTVTALTAIDQQTYRPQDCDMLGDWTRQINGWIHRIDQLLNPEPTKEVLANCPACGSRYHYRRHAGEQIREAALQVTGATGCTCLCCKTNWGPHQYLFLIKLIGAELPDGVLE